MPEQFLDLHVAEQDDEGRKMDSAKLQSNSELVINMSSPVND
jgi:hypothetical protein